MSELSKSSTASREPAGADRAVGRLAVWLSLISIILYFLASRGVANYFRWLVRVAGKAGP